MIVPGSARPRWPPEWARVGQLKCGKIWDGILAWRRRAAASAFMRSSEASPRFWAIKWAETARTPVVNVAKQELAKIGAILTGL